MECAKNTNILFLFTLVNCQGCGLVVFVYCLQEFAGVSAVKFTSGETSFRILFRVATSDVFFSGVVWQDQSK